MTRTVSATISAAVAENTTQPIYLIRMGWTAASPDINRRIATWGADLSWNSETWEASGADVKRLNAGGGTLTLPNGDNDPWLALVTAQIPKGRTIDVYEYHTDFTASPITSDATILLSGVMEDCEITQEVITISFIEGLLNKSFPISSIDPTVYTNLISAGNRIYWGPDIVLAE
jgi:hypothetical protein